MAPPDDVWPEIIANALEWGLRTSKGPIPGAKLRELIVRAASKYGQSYPPVGLEDEKFGEFLKRYSSSVIVLRREGRDILIAPADKPELLAGAEDSRQAKLRDDIFEAFTQISSEVPPKQPWYAKDTDSIQWASADRPLDAKRFVQIPPATKLQELDDRKAFALSIDIENQRDVLLAALGEHSALFAFSKTVKEFGLGRKWHLYRFQALVKRIRSWCESENIDWRDEWIGAKPDTSNRVQLPHLVPPTLQQPTALARFVEKLSSDDLKRVSVPLDIVLKLLQ
jgi:hypothetical protein